MPAPYTILLRGPSNASVAVFCFYVGLLAIFIGVYVWLAKRPDILPGYKVNDIRDVALYAKLRGQSIMAVGFALLVMSFPINAENPDILILAATLIFVVFLLLTALYLHLQARKLTEK